MFLMYLMHRSNDGRFSSDNKEWAKSLEPHAMWENRDYIVTSHPAVLNGFINQTRRYMEQEKELAAQADKAAFAIDGQMCIKVDEWQSGEDSYLLGNSTEDSDFFYAAVNENTFYEYDYKPNRQKIEEDYLNTLAERDIDRHEAEVFARFEGSGESAEEPYRRFSVTETSDAFLPGENFAVWDDTREEYYHDGDGTVHTFADREEAEEYLAQVEKEVSEKEEPPLTAEDVQNLVLIRQDYEKGSRTTVYDFECDIRGEHDSLQYTLQ